MRIDAAQLAEDLMNAYKNNVKTKVDAEDELADRMSARLNEITGNYKNNASKATTVYNLPVNNEPLGPSIIPSGTAIYQTPTTLPNPSAVNEQTNLP